MTDLYDVLETCLQEIENGADVDTVLLRYPEYADELRPIVDQPHTGDRFDRGHGAAPAFLGERIGGKRHVAARHGDSGLVEHVAFDGGGGAGGEIPLH